MKGLDNPGLGKEGSAMGRKEGTDDPEVHAIPAFQVFHEDTAPLCAIQHGLKKKDVTVSQRATT